MTSIIIWLKSSLRLIELRLCLTVKEDLIAKGHAKDKILILRLTDFQHNRVRVKDNKRYKARDRIQLKVSNSRLSSQ